MDTRHALLAAVVVSSLSACNDPPQPLGPTALSPAFQHLEESTTPLVQHLVAPQATDPAIDRFLDNHYVWLDTAAQARHKLFVLMPGTGQIPESFQLVEREAARLGYAVIGLSYLNSGGFAKVCPIAPDPAACYENSRLEVIDGIDRSPYVSVNPANSIDNRLTKLLRYLAETYPDEGWSQFLQDGEPKWPLIAVSGLSQGGGEAAMIARFRLVDRVVFFSSVTDSLGRESVPWVGAPHVTPVERYWGLASQGDAFYPAILAGWDSIGLAPFGPATLVESGAPPYGWTHMLVTDLTPQGGFVGLHAHASTATDPFTPIAADGSPLLLDAWRYMLTALPRRPGAADLFASAPAETFTWSEWSTPVNLGPVINSSASDQHPAISKDGLSLYFSSNRPGGLGGLDIYVSTRASLDDAWGAPVNLGPNINTAGNDLAPAFSPDGHQLYFHSFGRGGCGGADMFVSRRHDKGDDQGWEPAENLGCVVNSSAEDAGPTILEDEATGVTTLIFTSTRPGGPGDFDIYQSTRVGDEGEFGPATLVAELSGPFRDTRTAVSRDGLELFLSSDANGRPDGIGGQDLWRSTRATSTDPWSAPVNLGPGVNTTAFDGAPAISFDGTTLYFFSARPGGLGGNDLYVTTRHPK
jgi:WD40 repeat protein